MREYLALRSSLSLPECAVHIISISEDIDVLKIQHRLLLLFEHVRPDAAKLRVSQFSYVCPSTRTLNNGARNC